MHVLRSWIHTPYGYGYNLGLRWGISNEATKYIAHRSMNYRLLLLYCNFWQMYQFTRERARFTLNSIATALVSHDLLLIHRLNATNVLADWEGEATEQETNCATYNTLSSIYQLETSFLIFFFFDGDIYLHILSIDQFSHLISDKEIVQAFLKSSILV